MIYTVAVGSALPADDPQLTKSMLRELCSHFEYVTERHLTADSWRPFTIGDGSLKDLTLDELVEKVAEESARYWGDACAELVRRGESVVPRLGEELVRHRNEADIYYTIVRILSGIPGEARNAIFLQELEAQRTELWNEQAFRYMPIIFDSLSDEAYKPALPVFTEYAGDGLHEGAYAPEGRMGMVALGEVPRLPDEESPAFEPFVADSIDVEDFMLAHTIFNALVINGALMWNRDIHPEHIYLGNLEHNKDGEVWLRGEVHNENRQGSWTITVGKLDGPYISFWYSYVCGGLCGEGILGVIAEREWGYEIVFWKRIIAA